MNHPPSLRGAFPKIIGRRSFIERAKLLGYCGVILGFLPGVQYAAGIPAAAVYEPVASFAIPAANPIGELVEGADGNY